MLNFFLKKGKTPIKRTEASISEENIRFYLSNGKIPWSKGYEEFKFDFILKTINSTEVLEEFRRPSLQKGFGIGLDDRVVEYPWIFSRIRDNVRSILDAGSTFNYKEIISSSTVKDKQLTIFTFYPENNCFYKNRISYVFGDIRSMPFKDNLFDLVVCQSTIEHIEMDNSVYGYTSETVVKEKSYEYLLAINELIRVLSRNGKLLLTFPFGKFKNYGFFQQLDDEMIDKLISQIELYGKYSVDFFKYERDGWRFANREDLKDVESYNPHTGEGKGDDGAAHCRSIACIEFTKL